MERSELLSLIREDYRWYEKLEGSKFGICKKIGMAFFNESFSITFWFRVCSYLQCKKKDFARMIIKSLSQFYHMNEQRLGIELPIDTRVMEDKIPPLWNHSHYWEFCNRKECYCIVIVVGSLYGGMMWCFSRKWYIHRR